MSGGIPVVVQPHKLLNDHCFIILKVFDPSLALNLYRNNPNMSSQKPKKNFTFALLFPKYG